MCEKARCQFTRFQHSPSWVICSPSHSQKLCLRESLLQWDSEFMSQEQLSLPAKHLRACDILDNSKDLCMDQHANTFSETLSQSMQKDIRPDIRPGIVPENCMGQETRTVIGTKAHEHAGQTTPSVKFKIAPHLAPRAVIGGKALQDWIKAKGFDGETTSRQKTFGRTLERVFTRN